MTLDLPLRAFIIANFGLKKTQANAKFFFIFSDRSIKNA